MPRVTVRIVKEDVPTDSPMVPLNSVVHTYKLVPLNGPTIDAASIGSDIEPAVLPCFPVALADMLCGGLVFTGAGPGRGFDAHAVDMRFRVASTQARVPAAAPPTADAPLLPPVPFAPRSSTSASAAGGKKGIVSSVVAGASSMAGVTTSGDAPGAVVPPWVGVATHESGAVIVGALSVPGAASRGVVSAVCLDVDALAVGFSDGAVRLWRVAGIEGLSTLTSWPSLRPRPDAVLSGICRRPSACLWHSLVMTIF